MHCVPHQINQRKKACTSLMDTWSLDQALEASCYEAGYVSASLSPRETRSSPHAKLCVTFFVGNSDNTCEERSHSPSVSRTLETILHLAGKQPSSTLNFGHTFCCCSSPLFFLLLHFVTSALIHAPMTALPRPLHHPHSWLSLSLVALLFLPVPPPLSF